MWLSGWTYRKSVTLSRVSGAITNYQMKLLVGESSGATGEAVDCGGLCLSTFDDIRFTTSDGTTLLDYWIESLSGSTPNQLATVWIEFDSIGTGATTFYMYYGKADATAYSSGSDTFQFFDDFSGDLTKWTGDTGSASISSGILTLAGAVGAKYLYSSSSFSGNIALRTKANLANADYSQLFMSENPSDATDMVGMYHDSTQTNHSTHQTFKSGVNRVFSNAAIGFGSYHIYDIMRFNNVSDTVRTYVDGVQCDTGWSANSVPTVDLAVMLKTVGASSAVSSDWILVRQYVETEPDWGSWGSEEIVPAESITKRFIGTIVETGFTKIVETKILTDSGWFKVLINKQ